MGSTVALYSRRFPLKTRKLQMNALGGVKMNGWVTEAADCALIGGNIDAQGLCEVDRMVKTKIVEV